MPRRSAKPQDSVSKAPFELGGVEAELAPEKDALSWAQRSARKDNILKIHDGDRHFNHWPRFTFMDASGRYEAENLAFRLIEENSTNLLIDIERDIVTFDVIDPFGMTIHATLNNKYQREEKQGDIIGTFTDKLKFPVDVTLYPADRRSKVALFLVYSSVHPEGIEFNYPEYPDLYEITTAIYFQDTPLADAVLDLSVALAYNGQFDILGQVYIYLDPYPKSHTEQDGLTDEQITTNSHMERNKPTDEEIVNNALKQEARKEQQLKAAKELEPKGLKFNQVPEEVYGGMPFITPAELIESGATRYTSIGSITNMVYDEENPIPAYVVGRTVMLPPEGVIAVLARDQAADQGPRRGRKPGSTIPKPQAPPTTTG